VRKTLAPLLKANVSHLLIAPELKKEKAAVQVKNVGKGEGVLRIIIGALLIVFAFFTSGVFLWVLGLVGLVVILTALFGY